MVGVGRWLAGAAIVVLAGAVLLVWRHGPASRTVQVSVYGTRAVTTLQQPGIAYGAAGHMIPPTGRSSTGQLDATDATLVLTTPAGPVRRTGQALPWQQTITVRPGQQVSVTVRSATVTSLECTIAVDGTQVTRQTATTAVTCRARS